MKRKVMTLAHQLRTLQGISLSEALKSAWAFIKEHTDTYFIHARKVDGTPVKRVVFTDWNQYNEVKGTGRKLKEGLKLFVDVAKMISEIRSTVSFYESNIISLTK